MSDNPPRPSATVALLRETGDLMEVYLVRRHGKSAFGNAWAFPGGVVEAFDSRVHDACVGLTTDGANALLDAPGALNYYSAAVREVFEETGVLLGDCNVGEEDRQAARDALNDGTLAWDDFVRASRMTIDCATLHYLSYWITPADLPKRFATRFFVAPMPEGQVAQHCGLELIDCQWINPGAALERHAAGDLPMIFPTMSTLRFLEAFSSPDDAIAEADRLAGAGITETLPKAIEADGKRIIVLPDDPRYAEASS